MVLPCCNSGTNVNGTRLALLRIKFFRRGSKKKHFTKSSIPRAIYLPGHSAICTWIVQRRSKCIRTMCWHLVHNTGTGDIVVFNTCIGVPKVLVQNCTAYLIIANCSAFPAGPTICMHTHLGAPDSNFCTGRNS
jgi:hypothetical protein